MSDGMHKIRATNVFQAIGLESIPTRIYLSEETRPTEQALAGAFGRDTRLVVRTGTRSESRNLPRVVGLTPQQAAGWILALDTSLDVLIQPYSEVVFSLELGVFKDYRLAEVVPGIWELDTRTEPAVLVFDEGWKLEKAVWRSDLSQSRFHTLATGYSNRLCRVEDWHVVSIVKWLEMNASRLDELAREFDAPHCIKITFASDYGLAPQNIRTNIPTISRDAWAEPLESYVRITHLSDVIARGDSVLLDVSIAREYHGDLDVLISKLRQADVSYVYLASGLLSHLAIGLREAGLEVRRFNG